MSLQECVKKIHFSVGTGEFEDEILHVRYYMMNEDDVCIGIAHHGRTAEGRQVELYHESHYPPEDIAEFFLESPRDVIQALMDKGKNCVVEASPALP